MESISQLLRTYDGRLIDCCYEVRMWMSDLGEIEQAGAFREMSELFGTVRSDKSYVISQSISEDDLAALKDAYGDFVDEMLVATIKRGYRMGLDEDEFYRLLWGSVTSSNILVTDVEQAFALYYMVIDRRLPYFRLNHGVTMDNDEFKKCLKQNEYSVKRVQFILYNDFPQKTEESSLLIEELNGLEGSEDQVVVMAALLDTMRDDIKRLKKRIRQLSNDDID